MQFVEREFSKRYQKVRCALFVIHEGVPPVEIKASHHRGTAAAIILPDGRFWTGVTLCSPRDQYVKAVGREKAVGRAFRALAAGQNGEDFVNEEGVLNFAGQGDVAWPAQVKFVLAHAIALAKEKQREAVTR